MSRARPREIPRRIVCLSAESADWLYRLGAWKSVVGVTLFFDQTNIQDRKPIVSGFSKTAVDRVIKLKPDLVLGFSDVQASIAEQLIKRGLNVWIHNARSLEQIEHYLLLLARVVDKEREAQPLLKHWNHALRARPKLKPSLRVYFEEWDEPLVCGIGWVSEIIQRAGARDVFSKHSQQPASSARCITSQQVIKANPHLILASWCGKPFERNALAQRQGWENIYAVRWGNVVEIPSSLILQPGYGLIDGMKSIRNAIQASKFLNAKCF